MHRLLAILVLVLLANAGAARAQTRARLSSIIPGTEKTQLVQNGDFQLQGPEVTNSHANPTGWSRQAEMFVGSGTNTVPLNGGSVAFAQVNAGSPTAGLYTRAIRLEPNTAYVLSAYLWNFGNAANRVTTAIDFSDANQEPQMTLAYTDASADQGHFVYRSFNTADTGTNITLRIFYDGLTGAGAAPAYAPAGAQWDNVAITKSADFQPPQASGSAANLRPLVTLTSPGDGESLFVETVPAVLPITAMASDLDGMIAKVEFFADATRLGETTNSPYTLLWSNVPSGSYQLTAIAADNAGATTLSAPLTITVAVVAPQPVWLRIAQVGADIQSLLADFRHCRFAAIRHCASLGESLEKHDQRAGVEQQPKHRYRAGHERATILPPRLQCGSRHAGPEVDDGLPGLVRVSAAMARRSTAGCIGFATTPRRRPTPRWISGRTSPNWMPTNFFATAMTLPGGSPARVYSPYKEKTVVRHFRWMKDNNLDGVFLQRFYLVARPTRTISPSAIRSPLNVRAGAETYGRVFAIMYDISGQNAATLVSTLTNDWAYLVNTLHVTNSPSYVRHRGKPVVAIWGFGFNDRPGTPDDALTVINWFKSAGCTVMGGVPTNWRTLQGDSQTNAAWATAYRAFDIISPWAVGRYSTLGGADNFKNNYIVPDLAECAAQGLDYMPVVFPGFSWHNLKGDPSPLNQIPRNGGTFYWRQVYNAISAGCTMIYGAMFDEVDEGTAMFKMAPTPNELPVEGTFVPLNIDGTNLPSDWYLRLADQASRMLRGDIPLQSQIPITP